MRTQDRVRAQTGTEYMLAVSVVVIAVFTAFYLLVGGNGGGPAAKSFDNIHNVVKEPYP